MKKLKYLDCIHNDTLYFRWIVQEYGSKLLAEHSIRYGGHFHRSGMSHAAELARRIDCPLDEVLDMIRQEAMEDLGITPG